MDTTIGTGKVSKREYEIKSERNILVPISDGVKVNVNVFRPDDSGKFPALVGMALFHLDYQDDYIWPSALRTSRVRGAPMINIESVLRDFFVRRGYVKVVGSTRGTGKSEGVLQHGSM
jgi:predicted acyl esterase